jgi:hypothetical protein
MGFTVAAVWALSAPQGSGGFLEKYNLAQFNATMLNISQDGIPATFQYNSLQYVYLNSVLPVRIICGN